MIVNWLSADWHWGEKKGYSSVATFSRKKPKDVERGFKIKEFDNEGRVLISHIDDFVLFNIYFPNGKRDEIRLKFKMDFYEAFLKVINEPPDVMLLDLYLPRLNGHDLLLRMTDMDIAIELIFTMSGHAHASDAQECLRLGANDHLLKPLNLERLRRSIVLRLGAHPV